MPRVSVIVPVFNGKQYLNYFLESLLPALPAASELIFVDDCSSEPVLEMIPDDLPVGRLHKIRNEQNYGYSVAVNRGLEKATGEILIQLNTDLILQDKTITALVDLIEDRRNAGIVGSKQVHPGIGLVRHAGMAFGVHSTRHIFSGLPSKHPLCCKTRQTIMVSGATSAFSRAVYEAIGPLDVQYFNTLENFDHCMVADRMGFDNYTSSDSTVYHWIGQSGPSRYARVEEGEAIFWSRWGSSRKVDLGRYVDEAIDHLLATSEGLGELQLVPINLCRSSDVSVLLDRLENRWPGIGDQTIQTSALNSTKENHWLAMMLPFSSMVAPVPYVYLVDRVGQLAENSHWFSVRKNIVRQELVLDVRAAAITTCDLQELYGAR